MGKADKLEGDAERRIIWIPAVPSSGTSAVAGVLKLLGVNMGDSNEAVWQLSRGYSMHEDTGMRHFGAVYNTHDFQKEVVLLRHFRLRDYINFRFIKSQSGRLGFKAPATFWLDDDSPESLVVDLVDVVRPLEDSLQADFQTNRGRRLRDPALGDPTDEQEVLRAGSLGSCMMAKQKLFMLIPPAASVQYYELLEDPARVVGELAAALELEASELQLEQAAAFVKPGMRHV